MFENMGFDLVSFFLLVDELYWNGVNGVVLHSHLEYLQEEFIAICFKRVPPKSPIELIVYSLCKQDTSLTLFHVLILQQSTTNKRYCQLGHLHLLLLHGLCLLSTKACNIEFPIHVEIAQVNKSKLSKEFWETLNYLRFNQIYQQQWLGIDCKYSQ